MPDRSRSRTAALDAAPSDVPRRGTARPRVVRARLVRPPDTARRFAPLRELAVAAVVLAGGIGLGASGAHAAQSVRWEWSVRPVACAPQVQITEVLPGSAIRGRSSVSLLGPPGLAGSSVLPGASAGGATGVQDRAAPDCGDGGGGEAEALVDLDASTGAGGRDPEQSVSTPDASPAPDVPAPDVPAPDVPAPDVPAPDVPAPDVPQGDVPAPAVNPDPVWDRLAQCESSGDWSINTGNGYYGGLQFDEATWGDFDGTDFAPRADRATREQQIEVATRVRDARGGYGSWPACAAKLGLPR